MNKIALAVLFAFTTSTCALAASDAQKPAPEKKLTRQQMKMKKCNGEAREKKLKGDERKKFMKSCLSGKN